MAGMMRFTGKAILITGGATGIGRAAALAFAREGAGVMIGDVDDRASETVSLIEAAGGRSAWRVTDVTDAAALAALVADCVERFGGLHAAFNNAGVLPDPAPLHEMSVDAYERTMAVNTKGVFLAMQAEIRHMLAHGGGAIVNTASVGAVIANPNMSPYVASKHAVAGLTRSAAIEYARAGIRVNAICPGLVETAMTAEWFKDPAFMDAFYAASPIGRAARPEEMVGMVLHLCSNEASFTNGSIILMDGGQTAI
jgi:NAD(P)-dependent dehydrogenase (short-subunit alcohol dehydrogenase family)